MMKSQISEYKEKHSESDIKRAILQTLNAQYCTFAFSVSTVGIPNGKGGFRTNPNKGCSDIIGCKQGRFFAMEVKRPGEKPSEVQISFLTAVGIAQGYECIVRSVEDALEAWEEI